MGRSQTKLTVFFVFLVTPYSPSVDIFYLMNAEKSGHFWTTYPPLLVNVVCEQPLIRKSAHIFFRQIAMGQFQIQPFNNLFPYFREPLLSYDISRHRRRSGEQFRNDWIEPPFKRKFNQQQVGTSSQNFRQQLFFYPSSLSMSN